jgi:hypothetical protein
MQFRAFFNESSPSIPEQLPEEPIFTGYLSDLPSEDTHEASDDDADDESIESVQPPPKKRVRRTLDIPALTACLLTQEARA